MKVGETVLVRVNGGIETMGYIIEIHGDIVRVAGEKELAIVRAAGRPPLGVGFHVKNTKCVFKEVGEP